MRVYYSDHVELPLPDGHRFPMPKYRRLRERLTGAANVTLHPATPVSETDLLRVHTADYVAKVKAGGFTKQQIRRIGFPWSPAMYQRAIHSAGGTMCAARAALSDGMSAHLAGGTHHAHSDWGQGFCIFNDVVVVARGLQAERAAERVVIIDLDVHQGNGSAVLCAEDDSIFTFSMHGERNFPFHKAISDLDIGLPTGCDDETYLALLDECLWRVLLQARADFAIYIAGADPFVGDRWGKMGLTKAGLRKRDGAVLNAIVSAEMPLAICMGGGYAKQISDIVDIQAATVQLAANTLAKVSA